MSESIERNLCLRLGSQNLRTIKTTHKGQPWKGPLQFEDPTGATWGSSGTHLTQHLSILSRFSQVT